MSVGAIGRPTRGRSSGGRVQRGAFQGGRAWMVAGALAGLALYVLRHRIEGASRASMVDWSTVERIATSRLRNASGTLPRAELQGVLPSYRAAMDRVVPLLERELGSPLPGVVERYSVVDRVAWVHANLGTFRQLIGHLEEALADEMRPRRGDVAGSLMLLANRFLTTRQIGYLLAFMGQRVLGQYDLAILSAEGEPGQLLFVEENVRATARALDVPVAEMRVWVALHETTHAFEFEAHPWVRPYLRDRLERQLAAFIEDARLFQARGVGVLVRRWRDGGDADSWLEALMTPEQRRLFQETQVVMSLLEGFSDWVMDEVGAGLLPDVDRMRSRFDERRAHRSPLERLVFRVTGLDLKLEQYRRGSAFVAGIVAGGGRDALERLWAGPHMLPLPAELDHPEDWLARTATPADGAA
jgi:coenzyme F420 biosynthesis associated uncharacterized protein